MIYDFNEGECFTTHAPHIGLIGYGLTLREARDDFISNYLMLYDSVSDSSIFYQKSGYIAVLQDFDNAENT